MADTAAQRAPEGTSHIRTMNVYGFRSEQWARLITVVPATRGDAYLVEFPDTKTDLWLCDDKSGEYEFKTEPLTSV